MKSQIWWYTARAGGIVAWALSAISVVWGLLLSSRVLGRRISGPKLLDLHRFLGGLAVVFTGVHLAGLLFDSYVDFGIVDLLVPMASSYKPGAVAWGVVATYLIVAVEVTSLLRRRVGEQLWRRVHYLGFVVFLLGTIHALRLPGTDVDNPLIWWPAAVASAAIVGLTVARVIANGDPVPARPAPAVADRPEAALIERTLEGLRALDDTVEGQSPAPVLGLDDAEHLVPPPPPAELSFLGEREPAPAPPAPTWDSPDALRAPTAPPEGSLPPLPLSPEQATSGSLFPSAEDLQGRPGPLDLTVPTGRAAVVPPDAPPTPPLGTRTPVAPGGAPARDLPVRTPRRLARTTAAADRIDAWKPARATEVTHAAPPPPPPRSTRRPVNRIRRPTARGCGSGWPMWSRRADDPRPRGHTATVARGVNVR